MATFEVMDATCDEELCRASTGAPVRFVDTSRGKVLSSRWDFGDGTTSSSVRPAHSWSEPGFYEVSLSVGDGEAVSTASRKFLVEAAAPAGTCAADDEIRCLGDSRFAVTVDWRAGDGGSGPGRVVREGTNDSALFRFFDKDNWEVLVKVLEGCSVNGHVWVYGASATTLGYTIRVTDTVTGAVKEYRNETQRSADAIVDAAAFPDACRER
ncbi:MAG: PKD domain-containing protein [Holophagales bacterium]|nr:PKD domain-containing protein [Holophagales bacterium]MYI81275.1 PKD domain-containing protein [Holophagales bacterium]